MDRNKRNQLQTSRNRQSLSARRAWIEILMKCQVKKYSGVALRKESVDRNNTVQIVVVIVHASLSARRAWIEIDTAQHT